MSDDGSTIAVGAPGWSADSDATAQGGGFVEIFVPGDDGSGWESKARLREENGDAQSAFGSHVAFLNGDSDVLAVAVPHAPVETGRTGHVAIMEEGRQGEWEVQDTLMCNDPNDVVCGWSLAASEDYLLIGAKQRSSSSKTTANVYVWESGLIAWTEEQRIVPPQNAEDMFGKSVGVHGDLIAVQNVDSVFVYIRRRREFELDLVLPATEEAPVDAMPTFAVGPGPQRVGMLDDATLLRGLVLPGTDDFAAPIEIFGQPCYECRGRCSPSRLWCASAVAVAGLSSALLILAAAALCIGSSAGAGTVGVGGAVVHQRREDKKREREALLGKGEPFNDSAAQEADL